MVKGWCFVVLLLMLMPLVFSQEYVATQITLKTEPNTRVWLIIKDQSTMRSIGSYNTTIDESGENILAPFSSTQRMLAFEANVYKSNSLIKSKNFSGFTAGDPLTLDLNVEEIEENVTETNQNESEINETEETEVAGEGLTGRVISIGKIDLKIISYIVGGIVVALVIVFVVYSFMQRRAPGSYKVTKLSEKLGRENEEKKVSYSEDKDIKEAEKKIGEMQKEIDKLKRIKEAERIFDEAKKELDSLRKS